MSQMPIEILIRDPEAALARIGAGDSIVVTEGEIAVAALVPLGEKLIPESNALHPPFFAKGGNEFFEQEKAMFSAHDPLFMTLQVMRLEPVSREDRSHRGFLVGIYMFVLIAVFSLIWLLSLIRILSLDIATSFAFVLLGYALPGPLSWLHRAVLEHIQEAKDSGCTPLEHLGTRCGHLWRARVSVVQRGKWRSTSIPRRELDRLRVRHLERVWSRVVGRSREPGSMGAMLSGPPSLVIRSNLVSRLRVRLMLRTMSRLIVRYTPDLAPSEDRHQGAVHLRRRALRSIQNLKEMWFRGAGLADGKGRRGTRVAFKAPFEGDD